VQIKAAGEADGLDAGQFEAIVSVFGNVDWYGDKVLPGAFKDTLADWAQRGDPIPVVWSHRYDDPEYHIGVVTEAEERDEGLWIKAQLDLDEDAPKARQVYRLLKGRRVTQFSFSYDVEDGGPAKAAGEDATDDAADDVYELRKLRLYEVGPTLIGANPATELLGVKGAKAGRVLSAKNEQALRDALGQIETSAKAIKAVLAQLTDDGKATANEPGKAEDRTSGKADDPMRCSPADVRLYADLVQVSG